MIRGYLILLVIVVMYKNRRKKDFFNVSLFSDGKLQQGKMMTQLKMKNKIVFIQWVSYDTNPKTLLVKFPDPRTQMNADPVLFVGEKNQSEKGMGKLSKCLIYVPAVIITQLVIYMVLSYSWPGFGNNLVVLSK